MPLLQEKLKAPPLPLSVVARPRLNDFFALNERIRLLVVQAPSGYGKTTLLAERLPALEQDAAWLRLDQRDNQPERFCATGRPPSIRCYVRMRCCRLCPRRRTAWSS